jgi:hypothetical protein
MFPSQDVLRFFLDVSVLNVKPQKKNFWFICFYYVQHKVAHSKFDDIPIFGLLTSEVKSLNFSKDLRYIFINVLVNQW